MNWSVVLASITYLLIIYVAPNVNSKDVYSGGFKYFVSYPMKQNWYQAQRYCTYHGMYLVDVPTQAENDRLRHIIDDKEFENDTSVYFWTSGTDLGSENIFYWASSGHPVLYNDWFTDQPDNSGKLESDNCIEIRKQLEFKWNDDLCSELKYFICRETILLPNTKKLTCDDSGNKPKKLSLIDVREFENL